MNRISYAIAAAAGLFLASAGAHAADIEAGKKKVEQVCQACHGMDGNGKTDNDAKLAGQHADYLERALEEYATGKRKNAVMTGMSATLTAADRKNVAAYFASLDNGLVTVTASK